jgi:hypothetical protein
MNAAVYVPLLTCLILTVAAPRVVGRIRPRTGAWALTVTSLVAAGCSVWTLILLAATALDDTPLQHRLGMPQLPVPGVVAAAAGLLLAWTAVQCGLSVRRLQRHRARLKWVRDAPGGELVVVADTRPAAFAARGRIVVSEGMLRLFDSDQRRVLLAHERAHLRGRHPLLLAVTDVTAAINPLLAPARDAVAFLCERAADEQAVVEVGDRSLAAATIGVAGLAMTRPGAAMAALDGSSVVARVHALTSTPNRRWEAMPAAAALIAGTVLAAAHATVELVRTLTAL